jgi:hypothetical protein
MILTFNFRFVDICLNIYVFMTSEANVNKYCQKKDLIERILFNNISELIIARFS